MALGGQSPLSECRSSAQNITTGAARLRLPRKGRRDGRSAPQPGSSTAIKPRGPLDGLVSHSSPPPLVNIKSRLSKVAVVQISIFSVV